MGIDSARTTILKRFTNHRNHDMAIAKVSSDSKLQLALKEAATALVDYKAFSKGKALFKKRNSEALIARRNALYSETLLQDDESVHLPLVACYQKALKEMWNECDQQHWEAQAADEPEDIYS